MKAPRNGIAQPPDALVRLMRALYPDWGYRRIHAWLRSIGFDNVSEGFVRRVMKESKS